MGSWHYFSEESMIYEDFQAKISYEFIKCNRYIYLNVCDEEDYGNV